MGRNVLALVAGDETKHYLFYRDLALAAFAIDPSTMMIAAASQVGTFAMPGTGIPSFTRHAVRIAREGIYGLGQYLRDVLDPVLSLWDVGAPVGAHDGGRAGPGGPRGIVEPLRVTVERMAAKACRDLPRPLASPAREARSASQPAGEFLDVAARWTRTLVREVAPRRVARGRADTPKAAADHLELRRPSAPTWSTDRARTARRGRSRDCPPAGHARPGQHAQCRRDSA